MLADTFIIQVRALVNRNLLVKEITQLSKCKFVAKHVKSHTENSGTLKITLKIILKNFTENSTETMASLFTNSKTLLTLPHFIQTKYHFKVLAIYQIHFSLL